MVILVTGASRGIGKEIARKMAEKGAAGFVLLLSFIDDPAALAGAGKTERFRPFCPHRAKVCTDFF